MSAKSKRFAAPLALAAAFAAAGCDGDEVERVEVQPVTGRVLANGKPAAGAVLQFVPANSTDPNAIRPRAVAGDDGAFVFQTYDPGDGIPPGEYLVSVKWAGPKRKAAAAPAPEEQDPDGGAIMGPPPDYFKGKYANPRTSGLRVKVNAGDAQLQPINLH